MYSSNNNNAKNIDFSKEIEALKRVSEAFDKLGESLGEITMSAKIITEKLTNALVEALVTNPDFEDLYTQQENVPIEDAVAILSVGNEGKHLLVNFQSLTPINIAMLLHTAMSVLKKKDLTLYNEFIQKCQLAYIFQESEDEDWSELDDIAPPDIARILTDNIKIDLENNGENTPTGESHQ